MATREFERSSWQGLFSEMSKLRRGSQVDVEVISELGDQPAVTHGSLFGITADLDGHDRIMVMTGEAPEDNAEHAIMDPRRVSLRMDDDGFGDTLEIEDAEQRKILIRFHPPLELPGPAGRAR
jgi:hypothetical protein